MFDCFLFTLLDFILTQAHVFTVWPTVLDSCGLIPPDKGVPHSGSENDRDRSTNVTILVIPPDALQYISEVALSSAELDIYDFLTQALWSCT